MDSKTRLSAYCTKRGDDTVNLVTSRKTNARLARLIVHEKKKSIKLIRFSFVCLKLIRNPLYCIFFTKSVDL